MAEVRVVLYGGEQDGYGTTIDLRTADVPEFFYIWPVCEDLKISGASGKKRMVLANKLATLAYEYHESREKEGVAGNRELIYKRKASSDKALADPAV